MGILSVLHLLCATSAFALPPVNEVTVYAHRGASAYAPENTLAAFRLAVEMGAPWVEIDCSLTKDGHVVVMHDLTVDRTTNGKGLIRDHTLAQLRELDAGSWKDAKFAGERVPTLAEALSFLKGKARVLIEIKSMGGDQSDLMARIRGLAGEDRLVGRQRREALELISASQSPDLALTRKVVEGIRSCGMEHDVVIQSFSAVICLIAGADGGRIPVAILASCEREDDRKWENLLREGRIIGVDAFNLQWNSVTRDRISQIHRLRKKTACWTVDKANVGAEILDFGVDGIITNRPDVLVKLIASRKTDAIS